MLEEILKVDTELFIYLNNLGTSNYDYIWVYLSEVEANAIPYLFLFSIWSQARILRLGAPG